MPNDRIEYPINTGYIQVVATGHMLPAFWGHPDTGGTFPGVVIIHDRWGVTSFIRQTVQKLAQAGHYAIAPDLFNRQRPTTAQAAQILLDKLGETGPPYVEAAIGALQTHNHCNGDIGILGIGSGGTLALHMAAHHEALNAVVSINGDAEPYRLLLNVNTVPLLTITCCGERNAGNGHEQPKTSPRREGWDRVSYPDVGQDFLDPEHTGYHPLRATETWQRVMVFLGQYLTGPSQPPDIRQKPF